MATGQDLVNKMMTQVGKRYIFGFEVNLNDRNPRAFDCCLAGDSIVHTAEGLVEIAEVKPGDKVYSWDGGACSINVVEAVLVQPVQKLFTLQADDRSIRATANHPFLIVDLAHPGGVRWERLDSIVPGDFIVGFSQEYGGGCFAPRKVLSITEDVEEVTYDLQIEGTHNFVADGIVVHNSEIIEWALYQLGVRFPDGSSAQIAATNRISIAQALKTPGALLYKPGHIAVSRGDNTTIEAKGRNYGVGVFSAVNRFTRAGLVPQLAYGAPSGVVTSGVSAPAPVNLAAIAAGVAAAKRSVLRLGSRGNDVIWLQVGINNLSGRGLQTDGVFGESTLAAVLDLQRWFGLPQDGVVGARTWGVVYP